MRWRSRGGSSDAGARRWEASLLNNLGMTFAEDGDWPQALATFEDALDARRREGEEAAVAVARWMVAWTLRNLGRREEALAIQQDLHAGHLAAGTEDPYVRQELALLRSEPGGDGHDQIDANG